MSRKNTNIDPNRESDAPQLAESRSRLLALFPLAFFTAQAIHYLQINQLGHMLWMCNIGNLLLALGLFLGEARLIRVAVIWMVPGVAVWFGYVVPTWGALFSGSFSHVQLFGVLSSTLAHLGGFAVGIAVLRRVGMDGRAWLYAYIWYFCVQLLSRLVSPAEMNVNLAHRIQPGWEQTFNSYLKFWFVLSLLVGICLWALGLILKRLWPALGAQIEAETAPSRALS